MFLSSHAPCYAKFNTYQSNSSIALTNEPIECPHFDFIYSHSFVKSMIHDGYNLKPLDCITKTHLKVGLQTHKKYYVMSTLDQLKI